MKCIFCLKGKISSEEHIIPESIGGTICINEVCKDCNSKLSSIVDNPFSNCFLIQLARFNHEIGGKRNNVPFPFDGIGLTEDGQKISLDRNFQPNLKRFLEIKESPTGALNIVFSLDAADKERIDQMIGQPLRKAFMQRFSSWSSEKINNRVSEIILNTLAQPPTVKAEKIKQQRNISIDDLTFEFLKIAYEMWFRHFGYGWIEQSKTALQIRTAILNRDITIPLRGKPFCPRIDEEVPLSNPLKNHCVIFSLNGCFIRLFNMCCAVQCEDVNATDFVFTSENAHIILQDFQTGDVVDQNLIGFLETHNK